MCFSGLTSSKIQKKDKKCNSLFGDSSRQSHKEIIEKEVLCIGKFLMEV